MLSVDHGLLIQLAVGSDGALEIFYRQDYAERVAAQMQAGALYPFVDGVSSSRVGEQVDWAYSFQRKE